MTPSPAVVVSSWSGSVPVTSPSGLSFVGVISRVRVMVLESALSIWLSVTL